MSSPMFPARRQSDPYEVIASPVPILIVDDNAAKRLALRAALSPLGFTIVEADSGLAALRCVMAQDFAVILLDVCMPIMDGTETAALLRQRPRSEMTPIIFITAFGNDEIVSTDHYAEGAVDFIFAPVPPDELRAKVSVFANIFRKAEGLATRAREVQNSADRWRLLTDSAPIGIFQTDAGNNYVYTNPRWSEITGVPARDAAGRPWDFLVGDGQRHPLTPTASDVAADQPEISHRFEIRSPDSETKIVLVTSNAIPDQRGGIAGWVGTLADVTTEVGAESALSDARDEATEASRLKSDFLANMSHEIRTPMNGVIGMTDLLLETDLDPRQRDYAQTVHDSGEALLTILNDILDFSKVEAGKLDVEDVPFPVRTIVHEVVDLLAVSAQAKKLELLAVVESSVPTFVSGDPSRVRQVLTNLIGNAIKFTRTGEVVVRVTKASPPPRPAPGDGNEAGPEDPDRDGDREIGIHFEVSDTGDGIAPDKVGLIFQPFVQADTSTSRKYGGTGLGLAISSQLVDLMGGHYGVTSTEGAGSTFWFTIRAGTVDEAAGPPLAAARALAGTYALIVSDNATLRDVLTEYLTDWDMTVATATSGHAALAMLWTASEENRPFDVALLDWSMSDRDGRELTNAVVVDDALTARLVHLTDQGHEGDVGAAQSGVSASLSKPVHRDDLRRSLLMALSLDETDDTATTDTVPPSPEVGAKRGRLLLAEDNVINRKVAVEMLSSAGYQVDTVMNGAAAVRAVATHPYDAILMDCQMPELNGYEATAAIRSSTGPGRLTPIIAMTAGARREDRDRCLAEGMDEYLSKPVSKGALLDLVARAVTESRDTAHENQGSGPSPAESMSDPADEVTVDPAVFDELSRLGHTGDEDFLGGLVAQFVRDTEPLIADLEAALITGDVAGAARIAHSLKGSGNQLGGRRLAQSLDRLEGHVLSGKLSDAPADLGDVKSNHQDLCRTLIHQLASVDRQRSRGHRV
jgi:PAS domain S-box-containing protein